MRSEWEIQSISEIVKFNPNYTIKKGSIIPYVEMAAVPEYNREISYFDEREFKSGSKFKNGDTLFSRITPCLQNGKTARASGLEAEQIGNGSTEFIVISAKDNDDKDFVYYLSLDKEFRKYAEGRMEGSTGRQRVSWQALAEYELPIPPKDTRKKIAHILSTLDDKIELNRKMNQTLEDMAQALFKSWFVDFDPVHTKAKCSTSTELQNAAKELGISKEILELFPSEFEESELGMIPKGWEVKKLEDICDFQNGYSFTSKELHNNATNSIKVFKMGHIHRGGGFKEEGKDTYFTITDQKKMDKYLLKKGDLLMAMTDMKANMALLAHTALMPHNNQYLLNQRVGKLSVKKRVKVGYPYLYIFTNYQDTINDLRSRSNSGVQVNLTTKAIIETKILISSDKLLETFNSIAEIMFEKKFTNDAEIVSLQKTRDTLLPKLLSGELDVSGIEIKEYLR